MNEKQKECYLSEEDFEQEKQAVEILRSAFLKYAGLEAGSEITLEMIFENRQPFAQLSVMSGRFTDRLAAELIYGVDWFEHFDEVAKYFP